MTPSSRLFLPLLLALVGCGGAHQGTYEVAAEAKSASPSSEALAAAMTHWDKRSDPAELKLALAGFEQAVAADPRNREAYYYLVRGWYFLGDGHQTAVAEKLASWDTAISWGKKCLSLNETFKGKLDQGEDEAAAAGALTVEDVPCTYWTASALGKWAKESGLGKTLKNIPIAKAWISRVDALDPTYYYAATDRYWGAYYAAIPSFAGQDLALSKQHFEKAMSAYPDHLGNKVLFAENWAVKSQDAATFEKMLTEVLAASTTAIPGIEPEQEAEQRKARELLARKSELFLE